MTIELWFYYHFTMEVKRRTIETVEKIIAAFFRENRRMPTYAEMLGLLGVR